MKFFLIAAREVIQCELLEFHLILCHILRYCNLSRKAVSNEKEFCDLKLAYKEQIVVLG